ncbi:c-type cytochrome [Hyphobacterium sp.]|uniref:c-type cytochrome n=1 Tax=Hyphobacterium sp. TaxID=2004662 RepID=UPI003B519DE3
MRWIAVLMSASALVACGNGGETVDQAGAAAAPNGSEDTPAPVSSVNLSALPAPYDTADYDLGRRLFRRCGSCHTVAEAGSHRVGPNLYGLFGSEVGSAENFNYSQVLRDADFIWTPEQLDSWLANPREFLPGNRMSFVGLRDAEERRNVIAYLMYETGAASD